MRDFLDLAAESNTCPWCIVNYCQDNAPAKALSRDALTNVIKQATIKCGWREDKDCVVWKVDKNAK